MGPGWGCSPGCSGWLILALSATRRVYPPYLAAIGLSWSRVTLPSKGTPALPGLFACPIFLPCNPRRGWRHGHPCSPPPFPLTACLEQLITWSIPALMCNYRSPVLKSRLNPRVRAVTHAVLLPCWILHAFLQDWTQCLARPAPATLPRCHRWDEFSRFVPLLLLPSARAGPGARLSPGRSPWQSRGVSQQESAPPKVCPG